MVVLRGRSRDIARRPHVHWLDLDGRPCVGRPADRRARLSKHLLFRGLGRDDHNNPSLAFLRDGRLIVFFCPHSGHDLPPPDIPSKIYYRISQRAHSIDGWGPLHTVNINALGSLGYAYPNPIQLRDKLWLFWRGGGWNPTFSYTTDRLTWTPARELVYRGGGRTALHEVRRRRGQAYPRHLHRRPPDGLQEQSVLPALREPGPVRGQRAQARIAGQRAVARVKARRIYKYSDAGGRAWGHDIALSDRGGPRVVYTRRIGARDTFYYAYFNGTKWVSRKIVEAGPGRPSFTSGAQASTTRTRGSSTSRAGPASGIRWKRGLRPTTAARGRHSG
jgi:hypothetical protein